MTNNQGEPGEGVPPTNDREAFLAAILAQPDDDVARLVFADWLQEHGQDARAQFIRAQVWAAQAEPFSREARKQERIAQRIRETVNSGDWVRPLQSRTLTWLFRRGFIDHVQVNVATFPRDAAELFRTEPIRSLHMLRYASGATTIPLEPVLETPQLERITRLDISERQFSPVELELVEACRYLGNLTDLCLRDAPVMPNWIDKLISGQTFPDLAGLNLAGLSHLGPRLADTLPRITHRRLLRLNLSDITFNSNTLKAVLESRCVREIEELKLCWTGQHEGAVAHVNPGWMIPWNRLRVLDLSGQKIGDDGVVEIVKALVRRPSEAPLRWLGLANNFLSTDGVRALLNAPDTKLKLYHLNVRGNSLTNVQLASLQSRFPHAEIEG